MGGICAGASGRFLDMTSRRLDVDITELGPLAVQGDWRKAMLNSYCIVFGIQDLVTTLAAGGSKADVAAAACHSVSEQVYEQQLQEIDIREPLIQVGGTSLISGLVEAVSETLGGIDVIVPEYSQHIGAVGAALLVSGMGNRHEQSDNMYIESNDPEGAKVYDMIIRQIFQDLVLPPSLADVVNLFGWLELPVDFAIFIKLSSKKLKINEREEMSEIFKHQNSKFSRASVAENFFIARIGIDSRKYLA